MDQDDTWHGGRPHPRRLCVRWAPSPLSKRGAEPLPQFSANFYCAQTAGRITMLLGMEVGLRPEDFVFDGDQPPSPKRVRSPLPNFRHMSIVAKRLDGSRWHLSWKWALLHAHCARWGTSSPPPKGDRAPEFSAQFYSSPQCSDGKRCTSYGKSVRLSVCLSVCLSHAGIVSKRLHLARCSLHCQITKCV